MKVTWRSPSNIALIKYWGKHGNQLPDNPSLSVTLHNAFTETSVEIKKSRKKTSPDIDFYFENKKNESFAKKINSFLSSVEDDFSFIRGNKLVIRSENSFPHSSGIASSASSMSALVLCMMSIKAANEKANLNYDQFIKDASFYSRLASGSASRSVYPEFALWGKATGIKNSFDEYAIQYPMTYHKDFNELEDTILVVSDKEKSVSSRAGHKLMDHHPMKEIRLVNANKRLAEILKAISSGDWDSFIEITEAEALELHALMMTSKPSFILMKPNTLQIIERIKQFRKETKLPVCFTLDAGPNVHILYPYFVKKKVRNFIQEELLKFCVKKHVIYDGIGSGPKLIINE